LHPFRDGNGRVGRLLIPLFLYRVARLSRPLFYLSAYLERHRAEYYERLLAVSRDGDWTGWISFSLRAARDQAVVNTERVRRIHALYDDMKQRVREITRSQHSAQLVDCLFDRPIFRVADFEHAGIPRPTAHALARQLLRAGAIRTLREGAGRRAAILVFLELMEIAEGRPLGMDRPMQPG